VVDFNPYREWLGVETSAERPNHYELLGLPPFEADSDRILHAADQRLNLVRKVRPGPHIDQWQKVLDELVEIRRLLSDLEKKRQYDDQLRRQQGLGGGLSAAIVPANPTKQDSDVQVSPVKNLLPPTAAELAQETTAKNSPAMTGPSPGASTLGHAPQVPTSAAGTTANGPGWPPGQGFQMPAAQAPAAPANPGGYGNLPYGTGFGPVIPASYGQGAGGPPASAFPAPPGMSPGQFAQSQPGYLPPAGQPAQYGQQPAFGQQTGYGQQPAFGQQPVYGQPATPGQPGYGNAGQMPFGQNPVAGAPMGQQPYAGGVPGMAPAMAQNPYATAGYTAALAGGWGGNVATQPGMGMPGGMPMSPGGAPMALPVGRSVPAGNPMAPVVSAGTSSAFGNSSGGATAVADEPAPTVSASSASTSAMLAGRRKSSQSTLIASGISGVVGLVVLFVVLDMMKKDDPAVANAGTDAETVEPKQPPITNPGPSVSPNPQVPITNITPTPPKPPVEKEQPPTTPPVTPEAPPKAPEMAPKDPPKVDNEKPVPKPDMGEKMPVKPDVIADPNTDAPETPEAAVAEMTKALAAAKESLKKRNAEEAKVQLSVAASLAKAPDHQAMVRRLETLTHFVSEFWKGVSDGIKGLDGVDELEINGQRVRVVEFSEGQITIRAGKNLRYTLDDLPSGLAEVLFERVRDMKDPLNVMSKGAFHATDKNRTTDSARDVFQKAQLLGGEVDELLAVLDDKYDVKNPPTARAIAKKQHLPDQSAMSTATTKIKAQFGKEINGAKTAQQKYDMAKRLVEEAQMPMENEALRLAIFNEARDLAANAHLAQLTVQIIDETEKWFEIDVLAMKLDALSKASVKASPQASRDVAMECLQLTDLAQEAKRLDLADKFVRIASGSARTSRDMALAKRATDRMKEIQKEFKEGAKAGAAEKPATGKPGDAKAAGTDTPAAGDKKAQDAAAAKAAGDNAAGTAATPKK
jgi:hypothetical protein